MNSDDLNFTMAAQTEIITQLEKSLANLPTEISVNVILNGKSAQKYFFIKTLLMSSYPELFENDIEKFIVRSGVERELERINRIWNENEELD